LNKRSVPQTLYLAALVLVLLATAIPISHAENVQSNQSVSPTIAEPTDDFVVPVIYQAETMDRDCNKIQDRLESLAVQTLQVNESALPVVITLLSPVSSQDLEHFRRVGGEVEYVYDYVTYGFAGVVPASNLSLFAGLEGERLSMIEHDTPLHYHLDVSTSLIRARPTVWNTYGYRGSPNQSIAIIDTGLDDSHPDLGPYQNLNFSAKIVGWYDATSDNSPAPEDYGEHGSHVAGIAGGTGVANNLQGYGAVNITFTYFLPIGGYGYIDYIDVMTPGLIQLSLEWSGPNIVLLRLYDPTETTIVDEVLGGTPPLTLEYSTEGSSYPTGRYMVLIGNYIGPSGSPFSCAETYPYEGPNDGYNLFTGVAPDSKLVGVKVFDNTGSGTLGMLIDGMDWIVENRRNYHIVVASMSLSLEDGATDTTLDQKTDSMAQNGIIAIASAGNGYPSHTIGSPGTAAYAITVAATNDQNGITSYSSNGNQLKNEYGLIKPDVAAPGNEIISADSSDDDGEYSGLPDQNPDDYQQMGGTSMSAPHVAGLAALAAQALGNWNWTLEEALKVKMLTCMTAFETQAGEGTNVPPLDRGGKDSKEGYGRVSADAVIEAATLNYTVGEEASDTLGAGASDKKVWARQVEIEAGAAYTFNLTVPEGADCDLFMYNGVPDSYGQPVILAKSVNASSGVNDAIQFTSSTSSRAYILVKWASGEGTFTLSSSSRVPRDVAVTDVTASETVVYVGEMVDITVTVHNYGEVAESFNVTTFYNTTEIQLKTVSALAAGASEVLTFNWDTSEMHPCSNYTIRAEASVVPDEANTVNNVYVDGDVKVKLQGDVNGDCIVNVVDLTIVALSYGFFEDEPGYDPDADLNEDGLVDMRDLVTVASNLGRTCS